MIGTVDTSLHSGLTPVSGPVQAYVSPSLETDPSATITRIGRAHSFFVEHLGVEPRMAVLVLAPDDWAERSNHPLYGMPNYGAGNLVIAGEPNPFWTGLVAVAGNGNPRAQRQLREVYGRNGDVDLTPFFDLLAVHELAHIFIEADGRVPPRLWILELACNVLLHSYVAAEEPAALPVLETFPAVLGSVPVSRFTHRTLEDLERSYAQGMDPDNYGWFQSKLHLAAAHIHDDLGTSAARTTWEALASSRTDDAADPLVHALGPAVTALIQELSPDASVTSA